MTREAAFRARRKEIAQPDVSESTTYHHFVIATTGPKGIKILGFDTFLAQIRGSGAISRYRARRRNMIEVLN